MTGDLVPVVAGYLAHKRALGRKFHNEEKNLDLLVAFAYGHGLERADQLEPAVLDAFFSSRPRPRPRSFNNLVGIVGCFLEWTVSQDLLPASPLRTDRRRQSSARIPFLFDLSQARQLLTAAAGLPDNSRAQGRGLTYHAVFALCYGLGLRAGEACGLRVGDVDVRRQLLVVRGGKFGKSRLVPHGPRMGELLARQLERAGSSSEGPLFSFGRQPRCLGPGRRARSSTGSSPNSTSRSQTVSRPRGYMISGTPSLSDACCIGIERESTRRSGSSDCRRSWGMSTRPRPPTT